MMFWGVFMETTQCSVSKGVLPPTPSSSFSLSLLPPPPLLPSPPSWAHQALFSQVLGLPWRLRQRFLLVVDLWKRLGQPDRSLQSSAGMARRERGCVGSDVHAVLKPVSVSCTLRLLCCCNPNDRSNEVLSGGLSYPSGTHPVGRQFEHISPC